MKEIQIKVRFKENESSTWGKHIKGWKQVVFIFILPLRNMSSWHVKYPEKYIFSLN